VVTSDNPRTESEPAIIADIMAGFNSMNNITIEQDREQAINQTLALLTNDDVLLLAGKGHEEYQEINGQRMCFSDKNIVKAFYEKLPRH
jgi:UDP-N-acetylmuramoyl-L-alanyl-D-glutamate--2,6-diaminopimelate ligase